nr:ORF90 [Acipenserid herpesvirus 1]
MNNTELVAAMDVLLNYITTHAHVLLTCFNLFITLCLVLFVVCYIKNPSYVVYRQTLSTLDHPLNSYEEEKEEEEKNTPKNVEQIINNNPLIYPMVYNKLTTPF